MGCIESPDRERVRLYTIQYNPYVMVHETRSGERPSKVI